jgi:hypothetical protein
LPDVLDADRMIACAGKRIKSGRNLLF